jgi:hypothetical protein
MVDFAELRAKVYRLHAKPIRPGVYMAVCPLCEKPIRMHSDWDLHEVLVPRGKLPPEQQDDIFTIWNCIPAHHQCHWDKGQTGEFRRRCLDNLMSRLGAETVAKGYIDFTREHNTFRRGNPPREGASSPFWAQYLVDLFC